MHATPPYELTYANAALMLVLFDVPRDDFDNILTDAIGKLEPMREIRFTNGAINYIKSLLPEARESST